MAGPTRSSPPLDTTEVDWSIDDAAPVRTTRTPIASGPFPLAHAAEDTSNMRIRWRNPQGEWSAPAEYRTDIPAARVASVRPLQDLVGAIGCYRVAEERIPPHLRCAALSDVPLGDLFDDLRWGTSARDLQSADSFDFMRWADAHLTLPVEPLPSTAQAEADCGKDATCLNRVRSEAQQASNQQIRNRSLLATPIKFNAGYFAPWRSAQRRDVAAFIATLPHDGDLYFEASPRGGGDRLSARISVADRKP